MGLEASPALEDALDYWRCARAVGPTPRLLSECATWCDSAAQAAVGKASEFMAGGLGSGCLNRTRETYDMRCVVDGGDDKCASKY